MKVEISKSGIDPPKVEVFVLQSDGIGIFVRIQFESRYYDNHIYHLPSSNDLAQEERTRFEWGIEAEVSQKYDQKPVASKTTFQLVPEGQWETDMLEGYVFPLNEDAYHHEFDEEEDRQPVKWLDVTYWLVPLKSLPETASQICSYPYDQE